MMTKLALLGAPLACLLLTGIASAQAPEKAEPRVALRVDQPAMPSLENLSPTTAVDMWLYEQSWRRYDDPKQAVRRNAEFKAAQRRYRLAAMRWYGFSNSRPQASPLPQMGVYSPVWSSSHQDPYRWVGGGAPVMTIHVHEREITK